MLQMLAVQILEALKPILGSYYIAGLKRPAFKLDEGKNYVSPDSVEGLEVVIKPLGVVGIDGLIQGARLRYQADIYLIQHDIEKTSSEAVESLVAIMAGSKSYKVVESVPTVRSLALDSLDQTRIKVEFYTVTNRSKANGYIS